MAKKDLLCGNTKGDLQRHRLLCVSCTVVTLTLFHVNKPKPLVASEDDLMARSGQEK